MAGGTWWARGRQCSSPVAAGGRMGWGRWRRADRRGCWCRRRGCGRARASEERRRRGCHGVVWRGRRSWGERSAGCAAVGDRSEETTRGRRTCEGRDVKNDVMMKAAAAAAAAAADGWMEESPRAVARATGKVVDVLVTAERRSATETEQSFKSRVVARNMRMMELTSLRQTYVPRPKVTNKLLTVLFQTTTMTTAVIINH
nr:hypothetical protein CFP56_63767 [Quercus suber]